MLRLRKTTANDKQQIRFFPLVVYEPNVLLVVSECVTIFYHLLKHSHDYTNVFLKSILASMMEKWKTCFTDFSFIYGIAIILDPCFKTENLTKLIGFY